MRRVRSVPGVKMGEATVGEAAGAGDLGPVWEPSPDLPPSCSAPPRPETSRHWCPVAAPSPVVPAQSSGTRQPEQSNPSLTLESAQ